MMPACVLAPSPCLLPCWPFPRAARPVDPAIPTTVFPPAQRLRRIGRELDPGDLGQRRDTTPENRLHRRCRVANDHDAGRPPGADRRVRRRPVAAACCPDRGPGVRRHRRRGTRHSVRRRRGGRLRAPRRLPRDGRSTSGGHGDHARLRRSLLLQREVPEEFNTFPGRTFRTTIPEIASIEANLAIANMDFFEFADNVQPDGVFRGFEGE